MLSVMGRIVLVDEEVEPTSAPSGVRLMHELPDAQKYTETREKSAFRLIS
jgi:hypothetical protein